MNNYNDIIERFAVRGETADQTLARLASACINGMYDRLRNSSPEKEMLKGRILDAEERAKDAENALAEAKDALGTAEAKLSENISSYAALEAEAEGLKLELSATKERADKAEGLEQELASAQKYVDLNRTKATAAEEALAQLKAEYEALKERLSMSEGRVAELETAVAGHMDIEGRSKALEVELTAEKERRMRMEDAIKQLLSELQGA